MSRQPTLAGYSESSRGFRRVLDSASATATRHRRNGQPLLLELTVHTNLHYFTSLRRSATSPLPPRISSPLFRSCILSRFFLRFITMEKKKKYEKFFEAKIYNNEKKKKNTKTFTKNTKLRFITTRKKNFFRS